MDAISFLYNLPRSFFANGSNDVSKHFSDKTSSWRNGKVRQNSLRALSVLGLGLGVTIGPQIIKTHCPTIISSFRSFKHNFQDANLPSPSLPFASASLALADSNLEEKKQSGFIKEPDTGIEFPSKLHESAEKQLTGFGVRSKSLFGLKSIRIYAFGVYADPLSVKSELIGKYGELTSESLKSSKWFMEDVIASDAEITVRLVIYYKRLKIAQVRNAFEESLGGKLKQQSNNAPTDKILQSFTSLFKDDFLLHRGTVIDISRKPGQVLETKIDGTNLGGVKSAALCKAFFSLYIGDSPFDAKAKEMAAENLAKVFS